MRLMWTNVIKRIMTLQMQFLESVYAISLYFIHDKKTGNISVYFNYRFHHFKSGGINETAFSAEIEYGLLLTFPVLH